MEYDRETKGGPAMSSYLSTRDVADLLRVSPETIRLYARQGRIPFETTPGGHRRYRREAVVAAMASQPTSLSIGPTIGHVTPGVHLNTEPPAVPMAVEVAALASGARRLPLEAPLASNEIHASLMRWASPARVAAGAR